MTLINFVCFIYYSEKDKKDKEAKAMEVPTSGDVESACADA